MPLSFELSCRVLTFLVFVAFRSSPFPSLPLSCFPCLVLPGLFSPRLVLSCIVLYCLAFSCLALPSVLLSSVGLPCLVLSLNLSSLIFIVCVLCSPLFLPLSCRVVVLPSLVLPCLIFSRLIFSGTLCLCLIVWWHGLAFAFYCLELSHSPSHLSPRFPFSFGSFSSFHRTHVQGESYG